MIVVGLLGWGALSRSDSGRAEEPRSRVAARRWYAAHGTDVTRLRDAAGEARDDVRAAAATHELDHSSCRALATAGQRLGGDLPITGGGNANAALTGALARVATAAQLCSGLSYDLGVAANADYINGAESGVTTAQGAAAAAAIDGATTDVGAALGLAGIDSSQS